MKKFFGMLVFIIMISLLASCGKEKKVELTPAPEPVKEEVYQPTHQSATIDFKTAKKYNYFNAPTNSPATAVVVNYNEKTPYAAPIEVKFNYANGDTFTYTISAEFGLWKNQAGKFRVISDNDGTVWLQGQTKKGRFCEFVFYGNPKNNNSKIKPNSYKNLPAGEIKYCK